MSNRIDSAETPVPSESMRRRAFLSELGLGFGGVALSAMLARDSVSAPLADSSLRQLTQIAPQAKSVI